MTVEVNSTYFYDFIPVSYRFTEDQKSKILSRYTLPVIPSTDKLFDFQQLEAGKPLQLTLLLSDFSVQMTRTNKPFLRMQFNHPSGTIQARMWNQNDAVEKNQPLLETYRIFDVHGIVDEFNGNKSLTVQKINPSAEQDQIDPFTLLPFTQQNLEELTIELFTYLEELSDPFKKIAFAAMNRFWPAFCERPAARGFHHNYLGGLLKHTIGLMRIARFITKIETDPYQATMKLINVVEKAHKKEIWQQFQQDTPAGKFVWKDTIDHLYDMLLGMMKHQEQPLNYDLLLTSILFHDIGKLLEYDHAGKSFEDFEFLFPTADVSSLDERKQGGISMDPLGVMIGHIPYGVMLLTKLIEAEQIEVSLEDIHHISHCILCHHALPEWGACIRSPQTLEGYIIHIVDFLDSRYENTELIK